MLNPCDAAKLAEDIADLHPDSVDISRSSGASDGLGGRTNTWTISITSQARVSPVSASEVEKQIGGKVRDATYYRIAFPAGTDIRLKDRVSYAGLSLAVEAVAAPRSVEIERVAYATRAAL